MVCFVESIGASKYRRPECRDRQVGTSLALPAVHCGNPTDPVSVTMTDTWEKVEILDCIASDAGRTGLSGVSSAHRSAGTRAQRGSRRPRWLIVETILVTVLALAAVKALNVQRAQNVRWILIPGILVVSALLPTWLAKREFPRIGLNARDVGRSLAITGLVALVVFPAVYLGLWFLTRLGQSIPLRPAIAERNDWITWLFYQFLYVAVAEEVFFRGYVQANVMRLLAGRRWRSDALQQWTILVISAACFAVAHVVVQGRPISLLTFLPGLLLAWLFTRTHALLAPIVFHALANVVYGIMILTLA